MTVVVPGREEGEVDQPRRPVEPRAVRHPHRIVDREQVEPRRPGSRRANRSSWSRSAGFPCGRRRQRWLELLGPALPDGSLHDAGVPHAGPLRDAFELTLRLERPAYRELHAYITERRWLNAD
jgi:hypothetical protein